MKTVSADLLTHIQQEVTTLCTCWFVERTDGDIFTYTDHDVDVAYDGDTYKAATGYNRTAVSFSEGMAVDNLDVIGMMTDSEISAADLRNGRFDRAYVEVFLVNWADPTMGRIMLRAGYFGEIKLTKTGIFMAELRGLAQFLNYPFGDVYQAQCRTDLGSTKCGVNLAPLTETGIVVSSSNRNQMVVDSSLTGVSDYYDNGVVTWVTGANAGNRMEVRSWNASTKLMRLFLRMPYTIVAGDQFTVYPGCNKTRGARGCLKFNNVINFRGEPDAPGPDEALAYPDAS